MMTAHVETTSPVSARVVESIAAHEGIDSKNLKPRLIEVIDPDALNSIARHPDVEVVFEFNGYEVTVNGPNNVRIRPLD